MTVAARLEAVRADVDAACRAAGRDPGDVSLVAVSKNTTAARVVEALEAGQRIFGENYVVDGIEKIRAVAEAGAKDGLEWHLIGQLQSNKAARAARAFDVIQSLASESAARAISRATGTLAPTPVLLQIRLGGPAGRGGVEPGDALELARTISQLPGLRLDGVMGVAPQGESPAAAFARLAGVLQELREQRLPDAPLTQMSAGMSGDFVEAIAAGATIVRVGTAIFGG